MYLLRKTTVQRLHLCNEIELLVFDFLQVSNSPEDALYLLNDVLIFLYGKHIIIENIFTRMDNSY